MKCKPSIFNVAFMNISALIFFICFFPANFGGKMGLFLGASIITIVELAEFCIYIITHIFAKFITVRSSSNVKSFKDQESHKADSKTTEVEWKQRSI